MWPWFYMVLIAQALSTTIFACSSQCSCKWKGGKQTVECPDKNLPSLPEGIDPGTQVLEFSGNDLHTLHKERFLRLDLINLQKIFMARCRITRIDEHAFKGLSNLVELDLSQNLLSSVPTDTFSDYPSLMRLSLSENPIRALKKASFKHLNFLTTLELSNCQIELIEDEAFFGLDNLEWLRLDGNRLAAIRGSHILPESLHGIDLHHNRWHCDCRLLDLHKWLMTSKVPITEDPKCSTPNRLIAHSVKTLGPNDLACLPDVSPTTLYLEINEGKNLSLLCRVSAIPEATVSWWFQGQILQNDSYVAPGLHLYYYIEEGGEDKRSELFIYNANSDDNGTFVCVAENPAGRSHSNYTIRVIVRQEPVMVVVSFPFEYVVAAIVAAGVVSLIAILCIITTIIRCRTNRRKRKKQESGKDVALHQQNSMAKNTITIRECDETIQPKSNGNLNLDRQHESLLFVATNVHDINREPEVPTVMCTGYCSPQLFQQPEQNPDLINDTESQGRRRVEGEDPKTQPNEGEIAPANVPAVSTISAVPQQRQVRFPHDLYRHSADVHLNPGCFLDAEGYPIDFGLPKMQLPPADRAINFYRTLPHNRSNKSISAANPGVRFSREAEFLSRTSQRMAYEHFPTNDVRYTVEGYPCHPQNDVGAKQCVGSFMEPGFIPSPPEGYKSENCCPLQQTAAPHWPPCLPGYVAHNTAQQSLSEHLNNASESQAELNKQNGRLKQPVLTESPDEGYEDEGQENDI